MVAQEGVRVGVKKLTARQKRNEKRKRIPKMRKNDMRIELHNSRIKGFVYLNHNPSNGWMGDKYIQYKDGTVKKVYH